MKIKFFDNVPLLNNYENVLSFNSHNDFLTLFLNDYESTYTTEDTDYNVSMNNFINIQITCSFTISVLNFHANYCYIEMDNNYQNFDESTKYRFYFINNFQILNQNKLSLILELDVFSTFNGFLNISDNVLFERKMFTRFNVNPNDDSLWLSNPTINGLDPEFDIESNYPISSERLYLNYVEDETINSLLNNIGMVIVRTTEQLTTEIIPGLTGTYDIEKTKLNGINQGLYTYIAYYNMNDNITFAIGYPTSTNTSPFFSADEFLTFVQDNPITVNIQVVPFILYDRNSTFRLDYNEHQEIIRIVLIPNWNDMTNIEYLPVLKEEETKYFAGVINYDNDFDYTINKQYPFISSDTEINQEPMLLNYKTYQIQCFNYTSKEYRAIYFAGYTTDGFNLGFRYTIKDDTFKMAFFIRNNNDIYKYFTRYQMWDILNSTYFMPQLTDAYKSFIASNKNYYQTSVAVPNTVSEVKSITKMATLGGLGTVTGHAGLGLTNVVGEFGNMIASSWEREQLYKYKIDNLKNTPDNLVNGSNDIFYFITDNLRIYLNTKWLREKDLERLTFYYKKYGYKCNLVYPFSDYKNRRLFNYVKLIDDDFSSLIYKYLNENTTRKNTCITSTIVNRISNIVNNGVRIWILTSQNKPYLFDFSSSNTEIGY